MDQEQSNACGAHGGPGETLFDYTCDDCMLPYNHWDPPELNDIKPPKKYGALYRKLDNGDKNNPKRISKINTPAKRKKNQSNR